MNPKRVFKTDENDEKSSSFQPPILEAEKVEVEPPFDPATNWIAKFVADEKPSTLDHQRDWIALETSSLVFSAPAFKNRFLPRLGNGKFTDAIEEKMIAKSLYTRGADGIGYWTNLPRAPKTEAELYGPFIELANAVTTECQSAEHTPSFSWELVYPRKEIAETTPLTECAAGFLPPVAAMLFPESKFVAPSETAHAEWSRIHIPISFAIEPDEIVDRLLEFSRQTLRRQPNRRFLFGLTITPEQLIVWRFDHTGIVGSLPVDIHDDRQGIIHVITSLTFLSNLDHGWDPTMRRSSLPSRYPSMSLWEVTMRNKESILEDFILFANIFISHGKILCGHTSRIWKAWRKKDIVLPVAQRQVFVLKDAWSHDVGPFEGETWNKILPGDGLARFHSFEVVEHDHVPDSTQNKAVMESGRMLLPPFDDAFSKRRRYHTYYEYNSHPVLRLIHSRMLMESYGWSIRSFASLIELVGAFHDIVRGHRHLVQQGFLHGDISDGNMLVTGLPKPNRGILIDIEMAHELDKPQLRHDARGTVAFLSCEVLDDTPVISSREEDAFPDFIPRAPIHELESMFWVLCWLCLLRAAPGSHRISSGDSDAIPEGYQLIFEEDLLDMASTKREILNSHSVFEERVMKNVASFFEPLKPTLLELFWVLHHGYTQRAKRDMQATELGDLHQQFMDILDKAESLLTASPPEESDFAKYCADMLRRRREFDATYDPIDYLNLKADVGLRVGRDVTNLKSIEEAPRKKARLALGTEN